MTGRKAQLNFEGNAMAVMISDTQRILDVWTRGDSMPFPRVGQYRPVSTRGLV
jgi:hypothetical protein